MSLLIKNIAISLMLLMAGFHLAASEISEQKPPLLDTLIIYVYPHLSPDIMTRRVQPLADYIARVEAKPVQINVANSYEVFLEQSKLNLYDFIIGPAHFASVLVEEFNYRPMLGLGGAYAALILSMKKNSIHKLDDLRDRSIAIPNPLSMVSVVALGAMAEQGVSDQQIHIIKKSTHDRALYALVSGEVDAAVVSDVVLNNPSKDILDKIEIIYKSELLVPDVLMLKYTSLVSATAIEKFSDSKEGLDFYSIWKSDVMIMPIDVNWLKSMRKYVLE